MKFYNKKGHFLIVCKPVGAYDYEEKCVGFNWCKNLEETLCSQSYPISILKRISNYFIVHKNKIFFIYLLQLML